MFIRNPYRFWLEGASSEISEVEGSFDMFPFLTPSTQCQEGSDSNYFHYLVMVNRDTEALTFDLSLNHSNARVHLYTVPFDYSRPTLRCLMGGDGGIDGVTLGPGEARVVVISKLSDTSDDSWALRAENFQ